LIWALSGQLHVPAALSPGIKSPQYPLNKCTGLSVSAKVVN